MTQSSPVVVYAKLPNTCSAAEVACFAELVLAGGEVNADTFPSLVANALSLACASQDGQLVAVGAPKRPNASYRDSVFAKAGAAASPAHFQFEIGWMHVSASARGTGLSSALVAALVPSLGGAAAYATSRVDNPRMHATLRNFKFLPVGTPYPSKMNEPLVQLFVRE